MGEVQREVKREVELEAAPAEVWEALVDPRLLSEWLADEVEMEPIPGTPARVRSGGEGREATVVGVEEERGLASPGARRGEVPSEVELPVEAAADATRLVVVERALVGPTALSGLAWGRRL